MAIVNVQRQKQEVDIVLELPDANQSTLTKIGCKRVNNAAHNYLPDTWIRLQDNKVMLRDNELAQRV